MKTKKLDLLISRGIIGVLCAVALLSSCANHDDSLDHENGLPLKDAFCADTVRVGQLPSGQMKTFLNLQDASSDFADKSEYTFSVGELVNVRTMQDEQSLQITSWSAQNIEKVWVEMFIPEANEYLPITYVEVIPAFSQFHFIPTFLGRKNAYRKADGTVVHFQYEQIDKEQMKVRLVSEDAHFKKLAKIDAQWTFGFSNYGWTPTVGEGHAYREMRPIYAREWVVIVTNYAYMMTTPEYEYIMSHFSEVMGGDLYDNQKQVFTAEKYQAEKERFKAAKKFRLGQSSPAYGGLGGGSIWTITDWNFYGHYASFSGWEAISHEFMHCMGYSHNSNLTYAAKNEAGVNVGWTELIWQLHMWLSSKKDLPYLDRNLLGFHKPEHQAYRDCGIRPVFQQDAALEKEIEKFRNRSRLVRYFNEHPLNN